MGLVGMGGVYGVVTWRPWVVPGVHVGSGWLEIGGVVSLGAPGWCLGVVGCRCCWAVGTSVVTWRKEAGCVGQAVSPPAPRVGR